MRKATVAAVMGAVCLMTAGCFDRRPQARLSIKDSAPPPLRRDASTVEDRARAEQWQRCAQRHVDYQAGRLNETVEQKRVRDEICAELHRTDHARK